MTEGRPASARTGARPPGAAPARRRSVAADDDPMAALEARLARLEKAPGLRERGRGLMARVIPDDATTHFRNAGREHLLGVRSIVDFWIERIDDAESRSKRGVRRESIEIE